MTARMMSVGKVDTGVRVDSPNLPGFWFLDAADRNHRAMAREPRVGFGQKIIIDQLFYVVDASRTNQGRNRVQTTQQLIFTNAMQDHIRPLMAQGHHLLCQSRPGVPRVRFRFRHLLPTCSTICSSSALSPLLAPLM